MAKTAHTDHTDRIHELEDELKADKQRNDELREEVNELNALIEGLREQAEEHHEAMSRWQAAFGMVPIKERTDNEGGKYVTWQWEEDHTIAENIRLREKYNKLVTDYNRRFVPGDVGRPLGATEAQIAQVLKLHKEGVPYRLIVDEVKPISLQTVRTIIGREKRADRTTKKRASKYMPDKAEATTLKWRKREFEDIPKQVTKLLKTGEELIKQAKGLGKST